MEPVRVGLAALPARLLGSLGETRHSGKVPRRAPRNTQQQTTLIQLRNELKRAVAAEDYEAAARLRDQIKTIEKEQGR